MGNIPDLMFVGWDEWGDGYRLPDRWGANFPMNISDYEMEIVEVPTDAVDHFILEVE